MARQPSTTEQIEVSKMEFQSSHDLIIALKKAKQESEYTIPRIEEEILRNGGSVSTSTLKRVFKEGSEDVFFNVEHTLIPIANVLLASEDLPTPDNSPYSAEIELLKAEIRVQAEKNESLRERNEILESRVNFLIEQIEKKDRRMDEKDEIIAKLMEKCL